VDIIRQVLAREAPVTSAGPHYPLPHPGGLGLGKPLKPITHPLRADLPIFLGAEGPKNVALAAEIADGWFPIFYSAAHDDMFREPLEEGWSRPGARRSRADFEVLPTVMVIITDDVRAGLMPMKASLGFYIGGMGAKSRNFHMELMARMGYEAEAHRIQDLFFAGKREEAIAAVPDAFADEISLVGPIERIRDRLEAWKETPVTALLLGNRDPRGMRAMAELLL